MIALEFRNVITGPNSALRALDTLVFLFVPGAYCRDRNKYVWSENKARQAHEFLLEEPRLRHTTFYRIFGRAEFVRGVGLDLRWDTA